MEAALKTEVAILVVLEMCMSLLGIVCNLLIVATVRQDETLRATTLNFLLFNLCFSNLLIAFFVKPISAIYTGYAMSTDQWQVRNIIDVVLNYKYLILIECKFIGGASTSPKTTLQSSLASTHPNPSRLLLSEWVSQSRTSTPWNKWLNGLWSNDCLGLGKIENTLIKRVFKLSKTVGHWRGSDIYKGQTK